MEEGCDCRARWQIDRCRSIALVAIRSLDGRWDDLRRWRGLERKFCAAGSAPGIGERVCRIWRSAEGQLQAGKERDARQEVVESPRYNRSMISNVASSPVEIRCKGVLFDMDGILISSIGSVERSWTKW